MFFAIVQGGKEVCPRVVAPEASEVRGELWVGSTWSQSLIFLLQGKGFWSLTGNLVWGELKCSAIQINLDIFKLDPISLNLKEHLFSAFSASDTVLGHKAQGWMIGSQPLGTEGLAFSVFLLPLPFFPPSSKYFLVFYSNTFGPPLKVLLNLLHSRSPT